MTRILFLLSACFLLCGCSTFLYGVGETVSFPVVSQTFWTKQGELIFYAGEIARYGHTYVFCDRYFAFASLLHNDPDGKVPPYSLNVSTPKDLAHCRVKHSRMRLSSTIEITAVFGIKDDLVPASNRIDRYRVNRAAVHLHSPLHQYIIRPAALFISWFEPSFPYVDVGGKYTRLWDQEMYRNGFEGISQHQVEAFCRGLEEDNPKQRQSD